MTTARKLFINVGHAESVSFLLLLLVAMPIKYFLGNPLPVKYVGWVHGALFMGYALVLLNVAYRERWTIWTMGLGMAAAFLPFGPYLFGRWYWNPKRTTGTQS
jgi:integral membrane protein